MLTPKEGAGREFAPNPRELASVMDLASCDCLTVYSCRKSKSPKLCRQFRTFTKRYYTSFIQLLATFLQDFTDFKRLRQLHWPISRHPKSWYQHKTFHLTTLALWVIVTYCLKISSWNPYFDFFQGPGYCFQ